MVTVGDDVAVVETDLAAGRLACPGCGDRLARWGWARPRSIREGRTGSARVHRPRRARCGGCGATHVLLAVALAARRADTAAVIAAAIDAKIRRGLGHRAIASRLGRPATTVRGWLRSFSASADAITAAFLAWTARDAPDAADVWPAPTRDAKARALTVLAAYAAAVGERFGVGTVTWVRAGIAATSSRLFTASWWTQARQHEFALPAARCGAGACA